jgi:hypothetical protein
MVTYYDGSERDITIAYCQNNSESRARWINQIRTSPYAIGVESAICRMSHKYDIQDNTHELTISARTPSTGSWSYKVGL